MAPTYTTLDEVKRVLRTADRESVVFSDSINEIHMKDGSGGFNHDFTFDPSEVSFADSFTGNFTLLFEFTDPSTFDVYKENDETIKKKMLLDSGQSTSSDYSTPSGDITVKSGAWGGTIESGDQVRLQIDSSMSTNDAKKYIEDTEIEVDSVLMEQPVDFMEDGDDRLFNPSDSRPVPNEIQVATTYLAAYWIYTDVKSEVHKEGNRPSYTSRWLNRAEKLIRKYVRRAGYASPKAKVFPKKIDEIGIENFESGSDALGDTNSDGSGSKNIFSDHLGI